MMRNSPQEKIGNSKEHLIDCAKFLIGCTPYHIKLDISTGKNKDRLELYISKVGLSYTMIIKCNITDTWGDLSNIYHRLILGCTIILNNDATAVIMFNTSVASVTLYLKYYPNINITLDE